MQAANTDTLAAILDDNVVYENVGWPTMRGRKQSMKLLAGVTTRPSMNMEIKIHRIAADGSAVVTERTDVVNFGPARIQFWVCGVFEVHDGRVTLWRDYFDMFDVTKAILRGVVATVFPSLRPTL